MVRGSRRIALAIGAVMLLALQATIMMLAFLIQSTSPADKGIGLFLMLLAALALLVGAVLRMQESATGPAPPAV